MDSLYVSARRSSTNPLVKPVGTPPRLNVSGGKALRRARSIRVVYFKESFYEVYGYLGLVMLLAFTLSLLAMLYMTVVQVIPNWTANFLMGTDTLDNGEFLLMSKPSLTIVVTSTLMLSVFACLYLWLIVFMLSYNSETTVKNLSRAPDPKSLSYRLSQKFLPLLRRLQAQTGGAPRERTASVRHASSRVRSFENLKNLSTKFGHPTLLVARVFYLFDLFFAVFAPIVMLMYSYYNFHVDRDNFIIREETLTPGSFDRIARLFADPIQVQLVKTSFTNLQITEGEYILVKCFLNLLGIYKWKKVIAHLILANRSRRQAKNASAKARAHPHSRKHTVIGGFIFICCSVGIAIYTALSISTGIENCAPYRHCPVYSYHWDWGQKSTCRCIVFMDLDLAPRTYNDWINAPDVTEDLRALASNGYLQIVQIINRALPELPEELRLCKNLKELHIENDLIHSSLEHLPLDMFSNMRNLRFLRTGELPNLDDLSGLTALYIADAIHIHSLPSLKGLKSLKNFAVFRRNEICCNGWATGYCDLANFQCLPRANEHLVQCMSDRIPVEDQDIIDRANGFLCGKNITQDVQASEPTLESTDAMCQGVLYRECNMNGIRGICYNGRMQVVHCDVFGEYEKMRRLQIARGVGDPCDPEEEKWLGCS
ncbi:uncharacterized protein PITG_09901 [Phytophthora infestans T30-4]|uniref:WLGC domain-containing protein n=1 Tax=Phytophthora infestans (strain T30-4) TaxID=403677 RepID=D0NDT5_PHYIT|nr:uncharacterized protein PITG_09901 [Phytophthora infestans T30-4]EEY56380.1 conserved hypothetical protein [Phytophthora infestans T30-4]|eukprot:XP_002902454.1 conserved hypothetical protein [Phytophthora infestans T30-4]